LIQDKSQYKRKNLVIFQQNVVRVVVMGSGQKFLTWVGSAIYGLGWENFKCQIFSLRIKKISSGRVKKYPGQRQVGLLFTAAQK